MGRGEHGCSFSRITYRKGWPQSSLLGWHVCKNSLRYLGINREHCSLISGSSLIWWCRFKEHLEVKMRPLQIQRLQERLDFIMISQESSNFYRTVRTPVWHRTNECFGGLGWHFVPLKFGSPRIVTFCATSSWLPARAHCYWTVVPPSLYHAQELWENYGMYVNPSYAVYFVRNTSWRT